MSISVEKIVRLKKRIVKLKEEIKNLKRKLDYIEGVIDDRDLYEIDQHAIDDIRSIINDNF